MKLDDKGRCCGRKPIHYKGGAWNSPPGSPMLYCTRCDREYDPETGEQRENWAWIRYRRNKFTSNHFTEPKPTRTVLSFQGEEHELT